MNKQHIIDEIKRTAQANGGEPLGVRRFRKETGIRDSDWLRHWPRFGDAIREAGLAPNKFQNPYDENVLIEKFIALMRELGRAPTQRELRFKANSDSTFPSETTFGRLGTKQQRASKILAYCQARDGYDDIIALCEPIAAAQPVSPDVGDDRETEGNFGFVYLMKSGRYYKIGRSNAAGRREYELAIQLPEKVSTVHSIRTDDPAGIEAYWHKRFESKRLNGEWFDLGAEEVKAFRRRKFM
jgi:Meiotically up-regulated gene 113